MKVLFVNTNENYGGASQAAMRIMRGVQKHGIDAQMFVKNRSSQAEDVISIGQFVPKIAIYRAFDRVAEKIKNQWQHYKWNPYKNSKKDVFLSDLRSMCCHGALQKLDCDIVHLHWFNQRFLDIYELKKLQKPIVWTLHDSWPFTGICHVPYECKNYENHCGACPMLGSSKENDLAYEVFEKKLTVYKDLDLHIVTPSRWLADCAKQSTLLGRFSITVIPNCLDTEVFRPLPPQKIYTKPVILYGAMHAAKDKNKGFAHLLMALRMLDKQGLKARLVVFGIDAQELPMQFENIEVEFVGYIRDNRRLAQLYSEADVMVVPSYSEVFGQTASEAMACGTPVVAFRCTGIQDVVEDGCGYLAEPYNTDDLANGIRYCIENNPDNVLGKAARESAVKRFAIDVVAKLYMELYEKLIDNR